MYLGCVYIAHGSTSRSFIYTTVDPKIALISTRILSMVEEKSLRNNVLGVRDSAALNASVVHELDVPQMRYHAVHGI